MDNFITEQDIINLVRFCKHDSSIIDIILEDLDKLIYGSIVRMTDSDNKTISIYFLSDNKFGDGSIRNSCLCCSLEMSENAVSYTRKVKVLGENNIKNWEIYERYTCVACDSYFDYQFTELWLGLEENLQLDSRKFRYLNGKNKRKTFYDSKQLLEDETDISNISIVYRKLEKSPEILIGNEFALAILEMLHADPLEMDISCLLTHKRIISLPDNKVIYIRDGISTCTEGDNVFNNFKELYVGTLKKNNNSKLEIGGLYFANTPEETELMWQYINGMLSETELKDRAYKLVKKRESK
jgi:hypothetical protein